MSDDTSSLGPLESLEGFELVIKPDGTVTFIDFPPELLEVAMALNPDDPLVCERLAILQRASATDDDISEGRET